MESGLKSGSSVHVKTKQTQHKPNIVKVNLNPSNVTHHIFCYIIFWMINAVISTFLSICKNNYHILCNILYNKDTSNVT